MTRTRFAVSSLVGFAIGVVFVLWGLGVLPEVAFPILGGTLVLYLAVRGVIHFFDPRRTGSMTRAPDPEEMIAVVAFLVVVLIGYVLMLGLQS